MVKKPGVNMTSNSVSVKKFIEGVDKKAFNVGALHVMTNISFDSFIFTKDDRTRTSYERGRQFAVVLKAKGVYWHGHVYDKEGKLINAYRKIYRDSVFDWAH